MVRNASNNKSNYFLKGTNMKATDNELQEIMSSLRLKELALREITNDMCNHSANIKALYERVQKEIGATAEAAREE
ncbi:hypothetical protein HMPREF3192_00976 [Atopobium deltae]|uniref:Uncharacterized protein n=2 Tax=Atopobium deltae TaxID=1393034 RepID=A0A133XSR0_9ACTN|nr:hypothetical protein HMPREF3192_00976 [Atopobium deltae]